MNGAQVDDGLRPRGSNQVGMRQFNERVVLQAIRLHGPLAKAEIARLTHLTAQTVQIIIARLEADALVVKRAPVRGKIGQPSVPMPCSNCARLGPSDRRKVFRRTRISSNNVSGSGNS